MKQILFIVILVTAFAAFAIQAVEQTIFSGAGVIESTTGGFKFPDGTLQTTAINAPCTAITDIPYVITNAGVYCLTGNLETSITTGNAITIEADNVVIDLNGWMLDGLGAGTATQTKGIFANDIKNITIRNGTIRGFYYGIHVQQVRDGHLIEYIRAYNNRRFGLSIGGRGSVIRHNQVLNTGGSTLGTPASNQAFGIYVRGSGVRVVDNDITNTGAPDAEVALAMFIIESDGVVVQNNHIDNVSNALGDAVGINVAGSNLNTPSALVVRNTMTNMDYGINIRLTATGKYRDNLTSNVTTPYTGGTDSGGNN